MNSLGYLHVTFAVDTLDDTLARLEKQGAQLVGEVVQYAQIYRRAAETRESSEVEP